MNKEMIIKMLDNNEAFLKAAQNLAASFVLKAEYNVIDPMKQCIWDVDEGDGYSVIQFTNVEFLEIREKYMNAVGCYKLTPQYIIEDMAPIRGHGGIALVKVVA